MKVEIGRGRWCSGVEEVVVGCVPVKHEGGWGESQNLQPSCLGSVAGALCETVAADGAWGWHGGPYQAAVAAVGLWGCET